MAAIVLADDGLPFDGLTADERPLGGAETAFAALAAALAARGHGVRAFARGARRIEHAGVAWAPVEGGVPETADLYVANRGHRVLALCRRARRVAFWIHNPARYLLKWRYQWPLLRRRPTLVFAGPWHAATYPAWGMGGRRAIIPLGVTPPFLGMAERPPPPPVAVFTSNPLRGLDGLLDLWVGRVLAAVPGAVLRVYGGGAVYGDAALAARMAPVLARAAAAPGVELCGPLAKPALAAALATARIFVYGGDRNETFCLAAAEAQAAGLPAVVGAVAALPERVRDGETGSVAADDAAFAAATVRLLVDDALWRRQHRAALAAAAGAGWDVAAARFERLAA
ncbi:MAG: glycosyltransferase [Alphaproteobacteria bacterium]|nr:glycosyltransferase [Alphaproteobacteria bacterium]